MSDAEQKIISLEEKYNNLHTVVSVLASKVDATNEKIDMLVGEMRDRDNRRADEISEIRNDIKEIYKTTDAKISEIRQSVQSIQDSGRNQTLVTFLGIAAMVVAVLLK